MAMVAMVMAHVVERSDGNLFERVGFESHDKLGIFENAANLFSLDTRLSLKKVS